MKLSEMSLSDLKALMHILETNMRVAKATHNGKDEDIIETKQLKVARIMREAEAKIDYNN